MKYVSAFVDSEPFNACVKLATGPARVWLFLRVDESVALEMGVCLERFTAALVVTLVWTLSCLRPR